MLTLHLPPIFSMLNTDTFTCCDSVILDGSEGWVLKQFTSEPPHPPHSVILLFLLLQHPRLAVLGSVRLDLLLIFTCPSAGAFFLSMKSKFTWLFMA